MAKSPRASEAAASRYACQPALRITDASYLPERAVAVRPFWARVQLFCLLSRLLPDHHARAACQHIGETMGLLHRTPGGRVLKMPRPHGPASTGLCACLRQQGHRWSHPGGAPARPRSCRRITAAAHVSRSRAQTQRAPCPPAAPAASDGLAHVSVRRTSTF